MRRLRILFTVVPMLWTVACDAHNDTLDQAPAGAEWVFQGPTMGTRYRVVVPVDEEAAVIGENAIGELILGELQEVDARMSTWKPDSEVSRFNGHLSTEAFAVSVETLEVVARAQEVSEETGGAFDITVAPLIDAWGFGAQQPQAPPSERELKALNDRVGYHRLRLDLTAGTLTKLHPELEINLSAIAKGYAVDRVVGALRRAGVGSALVEVGGEVFALGRPAADRKWRVAIERPDGSGATQRIVELEDRALATSGDYRNFRTLDDGSTVSHLFDPRIRAPIQHNGASVSVTASDCTTADAWATALFVLGPGEDLRPAIPSGVWALFVTHEGQGAFSETEFDPLGTG